MYYNILQNLIYFYNSFSKRNGEKHEKSRKHGKIPGKRANAFYSDRTPCGKNLLLRWFERNFFKP